MQYQGITQLITEAVMLIDTITTYDLRWVFIGGGILNGSYRRRECITYRWNNVIE